MCFFCQNWEIFDESARKYRRGFYRNFRPLGLQIYAVVETPFLILYTTNNSELFLYLTNSLNLLWLVSSSYSVQISFVVVNYHTHFLPWVKLRGDF
jgi:hypothetical protein